ncbi:MAG TPA: tubulin-like doman-containing protein [Fimbriiglobus sp.]|nr:tubulin-like doman-containing protein [Fimbriiglobus sp.]
MAVRFESQAEPITGYRLIERLGSGGFGEVWKAEAPGGIFKAIKIIHGDLRHRENDAFRFAEQELKSLKRVQAVRHPYLLALDRYDVVEGRLMIVMELADCNLWDRFRECRRKGHPGIPRDELLQYMAEAAEVLDLMNDQFQLQHLDIKPQNLFLLYNHVKVADFGQVKDLQGVLASVTGGITPVYAAPETFDGFVSRFCDQYSLACVYQELLTGERPFDGTTMQQLLLQHIQMPPNLSSSPPSDRPALLKALAKKAEDRFPSISAMVQALRTGAILPSRETVSLGSSSLIEPAPQPPVTGGSTLREAAHDSTPIPAPRPMTETSPPPRRLAPPEVTGPGTLRPALVIGLGYSGLGVLAKFRKLASDRFGAPEKRPLIRVLAVDTDPDAAAAATGIRPDEQFCARLQRAGHYLKPRLNGRTLLEGWFDPQLLYRLPRNPHTMGLRAFGRLAFCDHYRPLMQKLDAELDACLDPQALADSELATGLSVRTNRPRVYVVAGLGGGTGGGMFLDVAYAVRERLQRLGYEPDVVGVLLAPPDDPDEEVAPQAQANTYAALTELHHYSRPETAYLANHDDRDAAIRDTGPPFAQVVLLPGLPHPPGSLPGGSTVVTIRTSGTVPAAQVARGTAAVRAPGGRPGSGPRDAAPVRSAIEPDAAGPDPLAAAAEFLRLDLFAPVGRLVEETCQPGVRPPGAVRTFGLGRVGWPRAEVVARAARLVAPVLINHWVTPDPQQVRQVIPTWAVEQWTRLGLDPTVLTVRLTHAADTAAGGRVEQLIAAATDPLVPTGWRQRPPEPTRVSVVLDQLQKLLGRVGGPPRTFTPLEQAVVNAADDSIVQVLSELTELFPSLIETPMFRLAGTEEAIRQVLALVDRARLRFEHQATEFEAQSAAAFELLSVHTNYQRGARKLAVAELTKALAQFPTGQYKAVLTHGVVRAYRRVRDRLSELLTEVSGGRVRVEGFRPKLKTEAEVPAPPAAASEVLPAGCASTEDAAQTFLRSLTDEDLVALDARVQEGLERAFGGLYQACLNSGDGLDGVLRVVREEVRAYLDDRVGPADLGAMLMRRHGDERATTAGLAQTFETAVPALIGSGPWTKDGVAVLAGPNGPVRRMAVAAAPDAVVVDARDEVLLYREYPRVPLAAVPQLGPAWAAAYSAAPEAQQVSPHARMDVTRWTDVDS